MLRFSLLACLGAVLGTAACGGDDTTSPSTSTGTSGSGGESSGSGGNGGSTSGSGGSVSTGGAGGTGGMMLMGTGGSSGTGGVATDGGGGGTKGDAAAACNADTGMALQFRGTGDDRVHADITKLPLGKTSRTVELWAYFEDSNLSWHSEHGLFEYGLKAGDATYPGGGCHEFAINSVDWPMGNAQGAIHPYGNCGSVDNNFFLPMGTPRAGWIHFSFSYDSAGNQFHFTINGSEMISNANSGITHPIGNWAPEAGWNSTKSPLRIGTTDEFSGPPGWQGKIDELRVWNVYRTADQIKANMKVILKGTEPGLVAYYHFDEGSGMSSADATGDTANAANFVGTDKATWPMWAKSDIPGPFTCAP